MSITGRSRQPTVDEARGSIWMVLSGLNHVLPEEHRLSFTEGKNSAGRPCHLPIPLDHDEFVARFGELFAPAFLPSSSGPSGPVGVAGWSASLLSRGAKKGVLKALGPYCNVFLGGTTSSMGLIMSLPPVSDYRLARTVFETAIEAFEAKTGCMSPQFDINSQVPVPIWQVSGDQPDYGTGWLTYVAAPDFDATARDWGSTQVERLGAGWLFTAPSADPLNDEDLFDKVVAVRDQLRLNGDIVRRTYAVARGENPDTLPPPPVGPQYLMQDGSPPTTAPPTPRFLS